jgi:Tol biopolymer transport system component
MVADRRGHHGVAARDGYPSVKRLLGVAAGVVLAVAAMVYFGGGASPGVATNVVRQGAPAWSPDGKQIAYYSEVGGKPADLFVMDAEGAKSRQLTKTPEAEGYPAWSPDGREIAFESHTSDGNFDVYVMNADGSNVRRLTRDPRRDVAPAWSPDGSKIAFMSDRGGREFNLYWMNADGTDPQQLTSGETDWFPQFSPDGHRLVFHRWDDVHVMDLDARKPTRLTVAPDNGMYPTWSPDGTRIAFMSWRGGPAVIYTMNADGTNQMPLAHMPRGSAIDPRWSPDGTAIVFVHVPEMAASEAQAANQTRVLYKVDLATGSLKRLDPQK